MVEFTKDYQPPHEKKANGPKTRKIMTDALMVALNREVDHIVDGETKPKPTKRLAIIADKLTQKAAEGDTQAIKEVFDRTEGKAAQALELTGDGGGPVIFNTIYEQKPE
jgi:N-acetylglucosamine kinase-like BadF-type ATPase